MIRCIQTAIMFIITTNLLCQLSDPLEQNSSEDDWWLPETVTASPNAFISFYGNPPATYPDANIRLVTFRWKDVNPTDGVYNWKVLSDELAKPGKPYMRMEISDSIHVPAWLFTKYPDLKTKQFSLYPYTDNFEKSSEGRFIPLWHSGIESELNKLLTSFKLQNFAKNPKFHHAYFPGAWMWGEYDRPDDAILISQGLTPVSYIAWFKRLVDSYIDAFHGLSYKLVYTGYDVLENSGNSMWRDSVGRKPSIYIVSKGCGARTGLLEKFNFQHTDIPDYGTSIVTEDNKNYMKTNDNNSFILDNEKIWINENEEFCYGTHPCDYYHLKMSVLKMLQLRMNGMYSNAINYNLSPAIHTYFMQTAGKDVHSSPDAWCCLREAKDVYQYWANYPKRKDFYVHNWEKWLYQRDIKPDGLTKSIYVIDDDSLRLYNDTSYEAKSTLHKEGCDNIYFNVDDTFAAHDSFDYVIKITFFDSWKGNWNLFYRKKDHSDTSLVFSAKGDNKWHTVSDTIQNGLFTNEMNGMDFRIYNGGSNDLIIRMVRLIRIPAIKNKPDPEPDPDSTLAKQITQSKTLIYPNPVKEGEPIRILTEGLATIRIYNIQGMFIKSAVSTIENNTYNIETNNMTGLYLIHIINKENTDVKKIIINN